MNHIRDKIVEVMRKDWVSYKLLLAKLVKLNNIDISIDTKY